ncbi:MAG TPA: hypothetical protein PLE61_15950, partial [Vicinamibacterales bacterium]|nr:hypothetical protein [Vicinamibacterales bacterium]
MATIEQLIETIPDARLREDIAREVAALKKEKKFGLVFEDHIPETIRLPGFPIRAGARVAFRSGAPGTYVVQSIADGACSLLPENGEGEPTSAPASDLVAVKRFGEPIYPSLTPVARLERAPEKPWHTLINADNYHALQLLLYCYEGQVDVIYIDP